MSPANIFDKLDNQKTAANWESFKLVNKLLRV